MGRPLGRLLDTEPLEGIGPDRAERQAPGYRHALNGAQKGAGSAVKGGGVDVISLRHLTPETLALEWEVRCGK
ncbi:hypothetical protein P7K49_037648 [Saguinus oedipus]|uniref:Uncharacterized protein n=1 Tax=Saguinus oedipus TaxID=9490 RepID=A0ABQ9TJ50_SAGOE|nr:hypothetical protein P7K49_037648 [Saguinus oedipus]